MKIIPNFFKSKPILEVKDTSALPKKRASIPDFETGLTDLQSDLEFIKDQVHKDLVPLIRKLLIVNSSLSLAVTDSVQLCNPGFSIEFDKEIGGEDTRAMREHLKTVSKKWGAGTPGLHGLINKLMYQVFIGGALSSEWVLKPDLSGVEFMGLIRPETISCAYNKATRRYEFYQGVNNTLKVTRGLGKSPFSQKIKLNPETFNYFELINDLEEPQGIPPFVSALLDLKTQRNITSSIDQVADQFGLLGFLQLLIKKPGRKDGEGQEAYKRRLDDLLKDSKNNLEDGVRKGLMAGYKEDHEFDFVAVTKDAMGLSELWDINHRTVANGLLSSPGFMGGATGGSETHINIIFTKMLSQMQNIQQLVKAHIEHGLWLELTLAGFKFNQVFFNFKESTITDELKKAQTKEIKIRNARTLYGDGIYGQEDYGNAVGVEKPDQKEPRIPINPDKIIKDESDRKKREDDKDTSDRKSRDKAKPQPKRKDQDTKKR